MRTGSNITVSELRKHGKFIHIEVNSMCDPFASFSICRINFEILWNHS